LKTQHALFVANYCKTRNLSEAARAAGYSPKSASVQGYRLSQNPIIAAAIAAHDAQSLKNSEKPGEQYARAELTEKKLKDALNELVDFDPADMYGADGELLPIHKMPAHTRKAIAGFEESVGKMGGRDRKFRLSSRLGAIEISAKLLGILRQEPQQNQAVQIIISAPPVRQEPIDNSKLTPQWED
jgi:phage terminase small subunit